MSSLESQERMKEEAKAIRLRLDTLIKDKDGYQRMIRTVSIYAGMLMETLLEYEEPDVVMEQAFHRIADLLQSEPSDVDEDEESLLPLAYVVDHDTELGRHMARNVAEKLPKGLDDMHEISIALVINDFPLWEQEQKIPKDELLLLLIENVIASLTYEMATQDFCELLIEEFLSEGSAPGDGLVAIAAVAGHYYALANQKMELPDEAYTDFTNVMVRESVRHGVPGVKNWASLAAANDENEYDVKDAITALKPEMDEFFDMIGMEDPLGQAVAVAKAAGRMVAVIALEELGQIHPSIAKSMAKTGMMLGSQFVVGAATGNDNKK